MWSGMNIHTVAFSWIVMIACVCYPHWASWKLTPRCCPFLDVDSGNPLETVIEVSALYGGDLWDEELVAHEDGCVCDDCAFGAL